METATVDRRAARQQRVRARGAAVELQRAELALVLFWLLSKLEKPQKLSLEMLNVLFSKGGAKQFPPRLLAEDHVGGLDGAVHDCQTAAEEPGGAVAGDGRSAQHQRLVASSLSAVMPPPKREL